LTTTNKPPRAPARALIAAAGFGALAGAGLGFSYLGGWLAEQVGVQARAERMTVAADRGFSPAGLTAAGVDASAQAIAGRFDPYTVAGAPQRDREAALFAARLERVSSAKASTLKDARGPAAEPFRLESAAIDASRELDCLTTAVYFEARGEGTAGKKAVAQVVLNRVRHPAFPNSVCAVVFQGASRATGCQFSFTCNGQLRQRRDPVLWERSRKVAAAALAGAVDATVGNATHFHATRVNPRWSSTLVRVASVGNHVFYRFGGRPGRPEAFRYKPAESKVEDYAPMVASVLPTELPSLNQAGQAVQKLVDAVRHEEPKAAVPQAQRAQSEPVQTEPAGSVSTAAAEPAPAPAEAGAPAEAPAV
jgi:spore germination cell wall hydrolase CwlJ-like protein